MYSVVLMVAATSGGDMASFGNKGGCSGCDGYVASCHGGGFLGLKDKMNGCCGGGGFLGLRDKMGCHGGGCHGSHAAGCTGTVVVEHHAAPAGCHGSATGCHGDSHGCCGGGGFLGLRDKMGGGGLFKKHKGGCHGCSGGCW